MIQDSRVLIFQQPPNKSKSPESLGTFLLARKGSSESQHTLESSL